ncbi:MAG: hypothetical protein I3J02_03350 [Prevotella sp.]|nr:hypothetical protein [Prevotella sp.]
MKTYLQPMIKTREISNEDFLAASPVVTDQNGVRINNGSNASPGGANSKYYSIWDTEDSDFSSGDYE